MLENTKFREKKVMIIKNLLKEVNITNFLKYSLTIFVAMMIPIYSYYYGPLNFLWFSDMGLFLTVIALWAQSDLIFSMAAVGILTLEIAWCLDFITDLSRALDLTKFDLVDGLSDYMFHNDYPLPLRLMSLFHVILPFAWFYYLYKWGYDRRAYVYFLPLYWADITLTYLLTEPKLNTNWVFMPIDYPSISQNSWLIFLYIGVPIILFLPVHFILSKLFKEPEKR